MEEASMRSKSTAKVKRAGSKRSASKRGAKSPRSGARRWSAKVTETSDALTLEPHVFLSDAPEKIAASLKRSAEQSKRRKGTAYQSAMSMLTFYINRAGGNLSAERRRTLERAKTELRKVFGRD
jgi:hypothetical protein